MFPREMKWLHVETGHVVAGVLAEIGMIPVDRQHPALNAIALASARLMDDPDNSRVWVEAFGRMSARLGAIHEGVGE